MEIFETKTETYDGIKYTTHYVNRPIRQGDPQGGSIGLCVDGINKTIEIITYVYKENNLDPSWCYYSDMPSPSAYVEVNVDEGSQKKR